MDKDLSWMTMEEALDILTALPLKSQKESVTLEESDGRILAQDIIAGEQIPPFSRSPFDGYAFRAEDTVNASKNSPVTLSITEEIPAGRQPEYRVSPGTAAKILTGAPIPEGADAVIKYEETRFDKEKVTIFNEFKPDTNIVHAGEDVQFGDVIAKEGLLITPDIVGLLAALGVSSPLVYKKPTISIVNTGDELLYADEPLAPAKIRNSSHYILKSYMEEQGAVVLNGGTAKDKAEEIAEFIKNALEYSDMVVTTGGVSVGDYDMVREAMKLLGAESLFWKINIKPGSAVAAGFLDNKLLLGLSGNPASAFITFHLLGVPCIHKLCGRKEIGHKKIKVIMKEPYRKTGRGVRYLRGRLSVEDGQAFFDQIENKGNGAVSSLKGCNLIGEIPSEMLPLEPGKVIEAYQIRKNY